MEEDRPQDWLELCRVMLDEDRLRVLGVLALHPGSARDVARQLSMKEQLAARHIGKLWEARVLKLVSTGQYALDIAAVQAWKRELFADPALFGAAVDAATPAAKVLANFVDGEQLRTIPANHSKRLVVLAWLAEKFQPGVDYPERVVNAILQRHYADYASLRRHLVDTGFLQRGGGIYRRAAAAPSAPENPSVVVADGAPDHTPSGTGQHE